MDSDKRTRVIRAGIGLLVPLAIAAGLVILAPTGVYLWLKAIHLAAAVTWIGGMLGLTYLLGWHGECSDMETARLLSRLGDRLLRTIVNPAMVAAWGIGLWLAWDAGWFVGGWLQAKLVLVVALSALHGWVVGAVRATAAGAVQRGARVYRDVTLMGSAVALGVIVLAVVKPM